MIKLRLTTMTDGNHPEIEITHGEKLDAAVARVLEGVPLDREISKVFKVLVNGHVIHPDLWSFTQLSVDDHVLVAPLLEGDDGGSILKQVLIIVATAVASVYLTPAGGATVASALGVAAVTIGTTLLLNAIIPPPNTAAGGGLGDSGGIDSSQMYSISGQSNTARKFETVPKVYGSHRMFPTVAANPYVELETDPATNELSQYLYAIYDFGLGPLRVEDLYIGDTPLAVFTDVVYRFVDFNRPTVDEGPWDADTYTSLAIYKGDVEADSAAAAINGNENEGGPQSGYLVIRNNAPNPNQDPQEVILTFYCPNGLYSYSSTGQLGSGTINLEIYFKHNESGFTRPFNDLDYVESWSVVGGDPEFGNLITVPMNFAIHQYMQLTQPVSGWYDGGSPAAIANVFGSLPGGGNPHLEYTGQRRTNYYGIPAGTTQFIIVFSGTIVSQLPGQAPNYVFIDVGDALFYQSTGDRIGVVSQADLVPAEGGGFINGIIQITLLEPTTKAYTFYIVDEAEVINKYNDGSTSPATNISVMRQTLEYFGYNTLYGPTYWARSILGKARIVRASTGGVYATVKFKPRSNEDFTITIIRKSTNYQYSSTKQADLTLIETKTRFDRAPIITDKRHKFMEIRIKATNQLNGAISNLSGICSSPLMVYDEDTETWSRELTRNPAWVFADLLTGEVNKRAIAIEKLHLPSLLEWAAFCDEVPTPPTDEFYSYARFECNFILDFTTTLQQLIQQVTGSAQASLSVIDGKYGVLIDKQKTVPVQIFTPRNSRDFSSSRIYTKKPDALKVKFVNPAVDWTVFETIVYDDGFNEENAIEFDELTSFAVTNVEQAWRFGRYMLAQNRLRQETMTLTVDFEHLVCTRGDFVQITQDSMKVGGVPCRVKTVVGIRITTDDNVAFIGGGHGYVFRGPGGIEQDTLTIIDDNTFDLDGVMPAKGDLIIIGVMGSIVIDCLVKSIQPNADLSATLVLVEKADAVYQAESLDVFPPYDPKISTTTDAFNTPPPEVVGLEVTDNFWNCANGDYEYYIDLDWDAPIGAAYEYFEILVNYGTGYSTVATSRESIYTYIVKAANLELAHSFKVLAVSATGKKLDLGVVGSVSATPVTKTTRPSDVQMLSTDITGEVLQLSWEKVLDCDVEEYLIRFSPTLTATWAGSIPLLRAGRNNTLIPTQARSGTYLIKAVDFNGNESANEAVAITTIPQLFGLNVVTEVTDFPDLLGAFDKTVNNGGTLSCKKVYLAASVWPNIFLKGFITTKIF